MTPQKKIILVLGSALFLSLSANLFMGGLMLGRDYHKGQPKGTDMESRRDWQGGDRKEDREARREEWKKRDAELREKLPEADRAIVEEHMKGMKEKFASLREAADAAEDRADAARAAEPFDQQAFETALKEQAAAKAALIGTLKSSRAGLMQKLSPEGQKIMKEMGPRFKGRDGDRGSWRKRGEGARDGERGGRFPDRRPEGFREGGPRGGMREEGPPPGDAPPPPPEAGEGPLPPPGDAPPPPEGEAPPAP